MPGQRGSKGGSIVISTAVLPNHENNKVNKQPDALDAGAIEATYAGNSGNNGLPSAGVAFSSGGSIAVGISGGNIGQGALSFNNKRPGAKVHQQQSAANNGDIGYQNTGNEASFSIGHGVSVYRPDASTLEAIFGGNSVNNELSSVGNGFSNENSRNHNTGNKAPHSIDHAANSNGNGKAGVGYNDGQSSAGYNAYNNDEPWIWNR